MHPLFGCWLTRQIIRNRVDDDLALPPRTRRHVENCAKCRRIYELEIEIIRQLSTGADSRKRAPGPFLHARIMRAVEEERASDKRHAVRAQWGWRFGGVTACALALLAVALGARRGILQSHLIDPRAARAEQAFSGLPLELKLPDQTEVRRWIGKVDGPLENEMDLVVDDAKTALNSLAANFRLADDRR